jgi:DNA-binding transcriptional MerR regulator
VGFKEYDSLKLYFSIGEASEILNVNASLIRFWEKEFSILNPKKKQKRKSTIHKRRH